MKDNYMKINEVITLLEEIRPGMERLVSYIEHHLGDKVTRKEVREYIKNIEKNDPSFIRRIKAKAEQYNNDGYIWSAIRGRTLTHFKNKIAKNKD